MLRIKVGGGNGKNAFDEALRNLVPRIGRKHIKKKKIAFKNVVKKYENK